MASDDRHDYRPPPQSPPPGVPTLSRDCAVVPTLPPVQVFHHAVTDMILGGKGWSDEAGETPPGYGRPVAGGTVYVHVSLQGTAEISVSSLPLLWKVAQSISWQTLVVAQALLAQWTTLTTSVDQAVVISLDRVLDYRGLRRIRKSGEPGAWQHGHRTKDRLVVAREVSLLGGILFSAYDLRTYANRGRGRSASRVSFHNTHFIVITDVWGQIGLMPGDCDGPTPTHIRYIPGAWMEEFARAGLTQLGRFLARNLEYDPYRYDWELAMASWLTLVVFPNNAGGGRVIHRAVDTILISVGQRPDLRHPDRTRRRFEAMMKRMVADGYLSGWNYVAGAAWPAKRWLATWLKTRIELRPSENFEEYYSRRNPRRASKRAAEKGKHRGSSPA